MQKPYLINHLVQIPGCFHWSNKVIAALDYDPRNVPDLVHSIEQMLWFIKPTSIDKVMATDTSTVKGQTIVTISCYQLTVIQINANFSIREKASNH